VSTSKNNNIGKKKKKAQTSAPAHINNESSPTLFNYGNKEENTHTHTQTNSLLAKGALPSSSYRHSKESGTPFGIPCLYGAGETTSTAKKQKKQQRRQQQ
jgi:hypothetical protein